MGVMCGDTEWEDVTRWVRRSTRLWSMLNHFHFRLINQIWRSKMKYDVESFVVVFIYDQLAQESRIGIIWLSSSGHWWEDFIALIQTYLLLQTRHLWVIVPQKTPLSGWPFDSHVRYKNVSREPFSLTHLKHHKAHDRDHNNSCDGQDWLTVDGSQRHIGKCRAGCTTARAWGRISLCCSVARYGLRGHSSIDIDDTLL